MWVLIISHMSASPVFYLPRSSGTITNILRPYSLKLKSKAHLHSNRVATPSHKLLTHIHPQPTHPQTKTRIPPPPMANPLSRHSLLPLAVASLHPTMALPLSTPTSRTAPAAFPHHLSTSSPQFPHHTFSSPTVTSLHPRHRCPNLTRFLGSHPDLTRLACLQGQTSITQA